MANNRSLYFLPPASKPRLIRKVSRYSIYAVVLREHPTVVKLGRTTSWQQRRRAYDTWNFADGDGVLAYRVYSITEEYVDLAGLEALCVAMMDKPRVRGNEWFRADLAYATAKIEEALESSGLSYIISASFGD